MSKALHTPGPWSVVQNDTGSIVVKTESPRKTRFGASRYAAIGGFDRSDTEQLAEALANASLIAAAPDLLAALQTMLDRYVQTIGNEGIECYKARAAIARATGEQV